MKLNMLCSSTLDSAMLDLFTKNMSSEDGIKIYYPSLEQFYSKGSSRTCEVTLTSTEVCREVLYKAASMVRNF